MNIWRDHIDNGNWIEGREWPDSDAEIRTATVLAVSAEGAAYAVVYDSLTGYRHNAVFLRSRPNMSIDQAIVACALFDGKAEAFAIPNGTCGITVRPQTEKTAPLSDFGQRIIRDGVTAPRHGIERR